MIEIRPFPKLACCWTVQVMVGILFIILFMDMLVRSIHRTWNIPSTTGRLRTGDAVITRHGYDFIARELSCAVALATVTGKELSAR